MNTTTEINALFLSFVAKSLEHALTAARYRQEAAAEEMKKNAEKATAGEWLSWSGEDAHKAYRVTHAKVARIQSAYDYATDENDDGAEQRVARLHERMQDRSRRVVEAVAVGWNLDDYVADAAEAHALRDAWVYATDRTVNAFVPEELLEAKNGVAARLNASKDALRRARSDAKRAVLTSDVDALEREHSAAQALWSDAHAQARQEVKDSLPAV